MFCRKFRFYKLENYSGYFPQVSFSREQQQLAMHLKYAEMLAIVVHEKS